MSSTDAVHHVLRDDGHDLQLVLLLGSGTRALRRRSVRLLFTESHRRILLHRHIRRRLDLDCLRNGLHKAYAQRHVRIHAHILRRR
jgi:hypothetical protein